MRMTAFLAGAISLCLAARGTAQNPPDHPEPYPASDIAAGAGLYSRTCINCHGVSGTGVGGIDLHRGLLPRARTDEMLKAVVTSGFPQAGMPAFKFTADELRAIVAYVRAGLDAATEAAPVAPGDAARGKTLVEGKGQCLSCHRIHEAGAFSGPDLTEVGRARAPASIWRSLVDPSSSMRPINRPVRAVTRDGRVVTGRRLNEDTYTVQLMTDDGRLVGLVKDELREWSVGTISPMPAQKGRLTPQELADVLGYLVSLKGSSQ